MPAFRLGPLGPGRSVVGLLQPSTRRRPAPVAGTDPARVDAAATQAQGGSHSKEDVSAARMARAMQYKATQGGGDKGLTPPLAVQPSPEAPAASQPSTGTNNMNKSLMVDGDTLDVGRLIQGSNRGTATGRGSETTVADFLKKALEQPESSLSQGLASGRINMEQYTAAREERQKQLGAEIISADQSYNPNEGSRSGGGEEVYKPKVTTWGVFPRPNNVRTQWVTGGEVGHEVTVCKSN